AMTSKSFNIASVYGVGEPAGDHMRGGERFAGFFVERHDDERLIVVRRPVARELADRVEQRLLDLLGGHVAALAEHLLEAIEAERLAVVVDRLDQSVAVKNEAVA